jgi:hypothetical protein
VDTRDEVIEDLYRDIEDVAEDYALARRMRDPMRRARILVQCERHLEEIMEKARAYRDPEVESLIEQMIEELR